MKYYKAFISFWFEHGVFAKEHVIKELGIKINDSVGVILNFKLSRRYPTLEVVKDFKEIELKKEALTLLSLFDLLANNHYYFLTEFGFTEKVKWKPHQYNYLMRIPAFELLKNNSKPHKIFKALYTQIENEFLNTSMSLRTEGIDLHTILQLNDEELNKEIKELKFELIRKIETVTNKLADLLKSSLDKADVIIGSGTFFSSTLLPLETAFLTCGIDTGSFTLLNNQREITVNPFLLFWLISSSFKLSNNIEIEPSLLPVTLIPMGLEEKKIPIRRIKLKVYSPSKLCVEAFYNSEDDAKQWVKEKFFNIINFKKYFVGGDFLLPFTSPLRIEEIELSSFEAVPFIDATPYGPIIYKEGLIIPEISSGTEVEIEFFTNPLYDKTRPLILDTNVISLMAFPYRPESLFFRTFMENREILLPAIAIYELKRKFSVGKERLGIINALNRLTEMHGAGLIKIRVIGEITPESYEVSRTKNKKNLKAIKSDFRDSLILLEAKRQNAILFTNDKSLREIAILLGIPSISYNSLLDDVSEVLMEKEYVKEEELIKLVKESVKEVRGEEYTNEEIKMALSYLKFSGKIMFEGEFIKWIKTILSKKSFI